jgi:hypothetical protein
MSENENLTEFALGVLGARLIPRQGRQLYQRDSSKIKWQSCEVVWRHGKMLGVKFVR